MATNECLCPGAVWTYIARHVRLELDASLHLASTAASSPRHRACVQNSPDVDASESTTRPQAP